MLAMKSGIGLCVGVLALMVAGVTGQYMEGGDLQSLDSELTKAATADHLDLLIHENLTATSTDFPQDVLQEAESTSLNDATLTATEPDVDDSDVTGKKVTEEKPSVVPKKGVQYSPSVVPKKGADPELATPSVSARKGADPEQSIPSVSARKGADPELSIPSVSARKGADPEQESQSVSARKGVGLPEPKLVSIDPSAIKETTNVPLDAMMGRENVTGISESDMAVRGKQQGGVPNPQLIQKNDKDVKSYGNDKLKSGYEKTDGATVTTIKPLVPSSESPIKSVNNTINTTNITKNTNNSNTTLNSIHLKPVAAVDELDNDSNAKSEPINTAAVVFGIILAVSFIVIMVIGYRKFQDVWMRRHYAHVDFLVEGMYDEEEKMNRIGLERKNWWRA